MNTLFACLVRASEVGVALLAVALVAQWGLKSCVPASWRVWVWRVALLQTAFALIPLAPLRLALLPPNVPSAPVEEMAVVAPFPAAPVTEALPVAPSPAPSSTSNTPSMAPAVPQLAPPEKALPGVAGNVVVAEPKVALPRVALDWRLLLVTLYVAGVLAQFAVLVRSAMRVRRTLRACEPVEDAHLNARLQEMVTRLGIGRAPRLLQSESGAPFLTGLLRPAIVLPRALCGLELGHPHVDAVLAHELAHRQRRDLGWNALLWAIQTVLWFHPLMWVARRFHALEVESACDEMVLQLTRIAPKSYGALLLNTMNSQQSPLTAGVADGFFALKTRLSRLNQTPRTPRKVARVAFVAVMALGFGALVPFRLVARAQAKEATPVSNPSKIVSGVVVDKSGKPVAGATVYAMRGLNNGSDPIETTVSDADGAFRFSSKVKQGVELLADAGERGMGRIGAYYLSRNQQVPVQLVVLPSARARLRFLDPQNRPVAGLGVRLWRVGPSPNSWMALPKNLLRSIQATTDARGVAVFPPLPTGMIAQFELSDQISKPTTYGMGDLRGQRFAPLSTEEFVVLSAPQTSQTIRLQNVTNIVGRVSFPDGRGAGNVLVMARRINAAEERGADGGEIDQLIAQTRSNASGVYTLNGIRPGKYWIWIYPEKRLTKEWSGPTFQKTFVAGTNTQNFALSRGALIQGVVVSQATKQPVKGQTMGLRDSQDSYQYAITDARGFFQFRALGGKQHLWVHGNGTNSPPPGFMLPVRSEFDFSIKNGEKREFNIEMPGRALVKPVTGQVVGVDGAPVAGATVLYRMAGSLRNGSLQSTQSDEEGRFSIPARWSAKPLQLFAESGELTTLHSTIVVEEREVKLQLQANVWASIEGRLLDENKRPVPDAVVNINSFARGVGTRVQYVRSDANGNFRFSRLRPGTRVIMTVTKSGFSLSSATLQRLGPGGSYRQNISLTRAPKTLAGLVLNEDGKPARGFNIWASGQNQAARTGNDGRFFLPQVQAGPIEVRVSPPQGMGGWQPFAARGGDQNVVIRLSNAKRNPRYEVPKSSVDMASLVGKTAPEIRATAWSNDKATPLSSLRGQVVLLSFGAFGFSPNIEVSDFARSLAGRVQVVGVQFPVPALAKNRAFFNELARQMEFPIAVDAPSPKTRTSIGLGQTFGLYGFAEYVVIGRDGKIVYAGNELDRAFTFAATAG